ncbi:MAG TPA: DISARM system phospholipase D-like protein DrmC [Terriglobia bacterium]|nr:DISARM system phospholipase D-like protein DrmC [Terriglobia bacterium]
MADTLTILSLSDDDLRSLAAALRSGRLAAPFRSGALQRLVAKSLSDGLAQDLQSFHDQGFGPAQLTSLIDLLLKDRSQRPRAEDAFDLVTTGPDSDAAANRDTSVVVRELFANAEESVLVAGYAVYQGQRVFQALADRMHTKPNLKVQMFLDVRRGPGDTAAVSEVVHRFGDHFRQVDWPKERPLPELFYFPSSLEERPHERGSMHAKIVIIDNSKVFISSANFTEAAQQRNIEVGLVVRSRPLSQQLTNHFLSMVADGALRPIFKTR